MGYISHVDPSRVRLDAMETLGTPRSSGIAHTLFLDFVGYSRLSTDGQMAVQQELHTLVTANSAVRAAGTNAHVRRTGDGLFLVFQQSAEDPVRCAMELDTTIRRQAARLRDRVGAPFRVRMGIHSGQVAMFPDGDVVELAGDGINTAQRTMDCGDDGHILLSGAAVAALSGAEPWRDWLRDLGVCRVKHDELVHLWNLAKANEPVLGNEAVPRHVFASQQNARKLAERDLRLEGEERRSGALAIGLRAAAIALALVALVGGAMVLRKRSSGAARDVARFTRRVGDAARERRKAAAAPAAPVAPEAPTFDAGRSVDAVVPDMVGKTREEARSAAEAAGLKLIVEPAGEAANSNHVLEQSPSPGRGLVPGGVVRVRLGEASGARSGPQPSGAEVRTESTPQPPENGRTDVSHPKSSGG